MLHVKQDGWWTYNKSSWLSLVMTSHVLLLVEFVIICWMLNTPLKAVCTALLCWDMFPIHRSPFCSSTTRTCWMSLYTSCLTAHSQHLHQKDGKVATTEDQLRVEATLHSKLTTGIGDYVVGWYLGRKDGFRLLLVCHHFSNCLFHTVVLSNNHRSVNKRNAAKRAEEGFKAGCKLPIVASEV